MNTPRNNGYTAPPRKKNIVDYAGLRLSAPPQTGSDKRPSLAVIVNKNKIRFDVYTNVPNDKGNGNIRADLAPEQFFLFLDAFERVINAPGEDGYVMDIQDYLWTGQKRSDTPVTKTKLMVRKDKNGVMFISLLSYDSERPRIKFNFTVPWKTQLVRNGQEVTEAEISVMVARAYHKTLSSLVPVALTLHFEEPEVKDKGNNNTGGGYQNQNQNRSQSQQRHAPRNDDFGGSASAGGNDFDDFEDDIPM